MAQRVFFPSRISERYIPKLHLVLIVAPFLHRQCSLVKTSLNIQKFKSSTLPAGNQKECLGVMQYILDRVCQPLKAGHIPDQHARGNTARRDQGEKEIADAPDAGI